MSVRENESAFIQGNMPGCKIQEPFCACINCRCAVFEDNAVAQPRAVYTIQNIFVCQLNEFYRGKLQIVDVREHETC